MNRNTLVAVIALAINSCQPAVAQVVADDRHHCAEYTGLLRQEWPLWGEIQYQGRLFDFKKTETKVSFEFPPWTVEMPRSALIFDHFDNHQCTFEIKYNADPIFADGFEGEGCDDHDDN